MSRAASQALTLPHPQKRQRRGLKAFKIGAAGASLAVAGALAVTTSAPIAVLVGGALFAGALAFTPNRSKTLSLKVHNGAVVGLPDNKRVPVGRGVLQVNAWTRAHPASTARGGTPHYERRWSLIHIPDPEGQTEKPVTLVDQADDPVAIRTLAEGIARLAHLPLRWRADADADVEERRVVELDQPLVERLRQRGISPIGARDASAEKFELSTGERGDATIVFKVSAQDFHDVGVMLSVGAVLTGAFLATAPGAGPLPTLLVSIPLLGVGGLLGLWRLLVRRVLVVDPGGLRRQRWLFGIWKVWESHRPSAQIESLYLERQPEVRLVIAGDGFHESVGQRLTLTEAGVLKDILERALVGWTKDLPEAPSTPLNDPEAWTPATDESAPRCPRCQTPSLTRVGGELDEMRCTTCDGRFISAHGTERLIEGELGLDRDLLRDLEGFFSGERLTCPSCRSKMSPMRIKGEHVDLCTGCGGFWFDAGELASVSQGRYAVDVGQGSSDGDG